MISRSMAYVQGSVLCYTLVTAITVLSAASQLQEGRFAGNLNPEEEQARSQPDRVSDGVDEVLTSRNSSLLDNDVVHVVPPSVDIPSSNHVESDAPAKQDSPSNDESSTKKLKSARPLGKADSVGFVPPPEKETVQEDRLEQVVVEKENKVVTVIPTLPSRFATTARWLSSLMLIRCCSVIKPGRMSSGSWYIVVSLKA